MALRALTPFICISLLAFGCGAGEPDVATPNTVSAAPSAPAEATADEIVAARFEDENITLKELDDWIRNDLFERAWDTESELYDLRADAFEKLVTDRILGRAAAARNLSTDDFISSEVDAMGEISDEEISTFYEENKDQVPGATLEELTPRIREFLRRRRGSEYVQKLRAESAATFLLEQPRIVVAADGPSRGPDDAAVTIVEFSDFQCPFCVRAVPIMNELLERYPKDVRLVYRHLPLDRIHPRARPAAEASACADEQGKFWGYHDAVFANSKSLLDEDLKRLAEETGLDVAAWEQCMAEGRFKQKVQEDFEAARSAGISATPAFIVNGVLVPGAKPVEAFAELVEAELAAGKGS